MVFAERENGGPAFPRVDQLSPDGRAGRYGTEGMSMRDYFAAKAMQAILATNPDSAAVRGEPETTLAGLSYFVADAMILARRVPPAPL